MHLHGLFSRKKIRNLLLLIRERIRTPYSARCFDRYNALKVPVAQFFVIDCQRLSTMAASRPYYVVIDSIEKLKL